MILLVDVDVIHVTFHIVGPYFSSGRYLWPRDLETQGTEAGGQVLFR